MKKAGNYYYPKAKMSKLRLEELNFSPLWACFLLHYSTLPFGFPYFPTYFWHAQLVCVPVFLTQLPPESLTRTNKAICYPSGWLSIAKDCPTAMQIGSLNYSWLWVTSFKFKPVYPERVPFWRSSYHHINRRSRLRLVLVVTATRDFRHLLILSLISEDAFFRMSSPSFVV